jgi:hypothetical protein
MLPGLDVVALLVFVGIGRDVHAHGLGLVGMASTTWPFAVGLVAGWALVRGARQPRDSLLGGAIVSLATVGIGMALRVVSGQGTDMAFVLVALGFLGATMLGWRVFAAGLARWTTRELQA